MSEIRKYLEKHNEEDKNFISWMEEIETILLNDLDTTILDLPDECYREKYEKNVTSFDMAQLVIKEYNKLTKSMFG
jgi:hypothetical protein